MKATAQQQSREALAWRDVGHTEIRPAAAWTLVVLFLALLFAVPLQQQLIDWRSKPSLPSLELWRRMPDIVHPIGTQGFSLSSIIDANRIFLRHINEHEDQLEDESALGQFIRPRMQTMFSRRLGVGNEQAYVGRGGWLFFRPGIDYLTGPGFLNERQLARRAASGSEWVAAPQPDPRVAILDFNRQLAERGITLILMPTPVKPSIHPERFSARYDDRDIILHNSSYQHWVQELEASGVLVFDPSEILLAEKERTGAPQYLATDTHWRPEAMQAAASALADRIRHPPPADRVWHRQDGSFLRRQPIELAALGDIALMLDLPADQDLFPPEPVTLQQVLTDDGQFWRPADDAEVLVLGDSFSNIYSLEPMGWGQSAGLVEQVAYYLQAPVDRLVRNDAGAFATRDMLARELARGRDRLAGKKWVIWQFAARELAVGDWRIIPLELRDPPAARFLQVPDGESQIVTGIVQSTSWVPRPGSVPYRDHVLSLHVVDLPDQAQAVVYMVSMQDNVWTRAAGLRTGDEITLKVLAWSDVADQYDALNRSELNDFELQLQEPVWGEWWE